jgi:hypothetical protein
MGLGETQSKKIKIDFLTVNCLNDASINISYFPFNFTTFAGFLENLIKQTLKNSFSADRRSRTFLKITGQNFTENEHIIQ